MLTVQNVNENTLFGINNAIRITFKGVIMGCHTWFYRLIPSQEIKTRRIKALQHVNEYYYDEDISDLLTEYEYDTIKASINNPLCFKWIKLGYGFDGLTMKFNNNYYEVTYDYHDVFRIKNYPTKVLVNFRQLRRWLRRRYYKLTQEQIASIKQFWIDYPDGIIDFG